MLNLADILLTALHVTIIAFNLFGWIPKSTRKANLVLQMLTAASWFILGIWYGAGYCPLTDWQWQVKERLGEKNLPSNFVEYLAEKLTGHDFDAGSISIVIAVSFGLAVIASLYVNIIPPRLKRGKRQVVKDNIG